MNEYYYSCQFLYVLLLNSNVWVTVIDCRIDKHVLGMYYHRFVYTLLNRRVHSVIDDITCSVARTGTAETAPPVDKANQIPLGGLNEWT